MARRYFGTDGVRGIVGESLTPELVERLGRASALWSRGGRVFVGRDTRGSGPMLEEAVPYFNRRLLIKPGVTGWAQLRADYASDAEGAATKLSYDLWYLRHRNLLVDVAICAKTLTSVILRPGR